MPISQLKGSYRPDLLRPESLIDIFNATAGLQPHKIAWRLADQSLTYLELAVQSDRRALSLREAGVTPGDRVGVWLQRTLDLPLTILAILKAGAAYVPFDADAPFSRVQDCLGEAQSTLLITDRSDVPTDQPWVLLQLATLQASDTNLTEIQPLPAVHPASPAYAIFTSGSTGKPKGVLVSHQNACHWARAENDLLGVTTQDVVFQGFSPAFDMSVEEVWTAYLVGAGLVMGSGSVAQQADQLPALIAERGITVLHAVPSMVGMISSGLGALRLLNMGGEACSGALVEHLRNAGVTARLVNTYGPTETTVSATLGELESGRPISIGQLLPNYTAYIVDEALQPVPLGQSGELLIGGPSVALGYLNRPDLTTSKFIDNPFPDASSKSEKLYRTGDLVRADNDGLIYFSGRLDNQVKVRGYRIELEEVEQQIAALPGVAAAITAVKALVGEDIELVAFVIAEAGLESSLTRQYLREQLKRQLPGYMVPSRLVVVEDLPRLTSGKIDRKNLPYALLTEEVASETADLDDLTPVEAAVLRGLKTVFPQRQVSLDEDFFEDLPGHSLLAARLISYLRTKENMVSATLQHLYQQRNGRKLAAVLNVVAEPTASAASTPFVPPAIPRARYLACSILQALVLMIVYGLLGLLIAGPYLAYSLIEEYTASYADSIFGALAVMAIAPVVIVTLGIGVKWLLIGRYKPGDYPLWGSYYLRHWTVSTLLGLLPVQYLANTPLYNRFFRLLGAKIGIEVHLGSMGMSAPDLVEIGSQSSLGTGVLINNITFSRETMSIRRVTIGKNTYIGSACVIGGDCTIEDDAELQEMASLSPGSVMPASSVWGGSPATQLRSVVAVRPTRRPRPPIRRAQRAVMYALLASTFPLVAFAPLLPSVWFLNELDKTYPDGSLNYLFYAGPMLSLFYLCLFILLLGVLKWTILGRARAGTYDLHSHFYVRKWYVDQLFELSLDVLHPLFATLYLPPIYRMLGAKVGKRTEISTASAVTHDLVDLGDEAFIADTVQLGDPPIRHHTLILEQTTIGTRSFAGNAASIPQGAKIPDHCLIGVLSIPPGNDQLTPGSTWFGIPAIALPQREKIAGFGEDLTFTPSKVRILARMGVEAVRILFPMTMILTGMVCIIAAIYGVYEQFGLPLTILSFPLVYLGIFGLPSLLVTALVKWLLIGRYRPGQHAMWSLKVWLSEAMTTTYESLLVPFLAGPLTGTPYLAWVLRLFGAKVGKMTCLMTTDFTEFDMVTIGDYAVLNDNCGPQTHLFEDRIMKIGPVTMGQGVVIGAHSILLYESTMEDGSTLAPQSLLMKGEILPAGTSWAGSPAQVAHGKV